MENIIKNYIIQLIDESLKNHGHVVWYDPAGFYKDIFSNSSLFNAPRITYDNSYYEVRFKAEPLFNSFEKTNFIVYLKCEPDDKFHPLIELEKSGIVFSPAMPLQFNTTPSTLVRLALKEKLTLEFISDISDKIDKGTISLEEADKLADKVLPVNAGTLSLIFNTDNPHSIILEFISKDLYVDKITEKKSLPELNALVRQFIDFDLPDELRVSQFKNDLIEKILLSEFLLSIDIDDVTPFKELIPKLKSSSKYNIINIAKDWRNRTDINSSYYIFALIVQDKFNLDKITFNPIKYYAIETFPFIQNALISHLINLELSQVNNDTISILNSLKSNYWHLVFPELKLVENILINCFDLIIKINANIDYINNTEININDLIAKYVDKNGLFYIDYLYRVIETRFYELDFQPEWTQQLELLINKCRYKYSEFIRQSSVKFISLLQESFKSIELSAKHQDNIFDDYIIRELNSNKKTAYILIDAFRYEMGAELLNLIDSATFEKLIEPRIASVPTITPIGMLSLMLVGSDKIILDGESGKLDIRVGNKKITQRKDRFNYLAERSKYEFDVLKIEEIMKPNKTLSDKLKKSKFVIITSQEIDLINESGNELLTNQILSGILASIKKAVFNLFTFGFQKIIISSDHGYFIGNEIGKDLKITPPNGVTFGLHKRCWIGKGGGNPQGTIRIESNKFGYDSDADFVFPTENAIFNTTNSENNYFHGGISLQELIIPVISLTPIKPYQKPLKKTEDYLISFNKDAVTNRIFTVKVEYNIPELAFDNKELHSKKVILKVYDNNNEIGSAEASDYGFNDTTKEIDLIENKPNVVTILIGAKIDADKISLCLIDANTGVILTKLENVPLKLSI